MAIAPNLQWDNTAESVSAEAQPLWRFFTRMGNEPRRLEMQVSEVMTQGVECTQPNAVLQDAAQKMRDLDIGLLPVCGDNDRLVGTLTDRDITIRAVAEGRDARKSLVRDVMTPNIIYCFEDQAVEKAAQLMKENQV